MGETPMCKYMYINSIGPSSWIKMATELNVEWLLSWVTMRVSLLPLQGSLRGASLVKCVFNSGSESGCVHPS